MKEATKAMKRRWAEADFPWRDIFRGPGIDLGCGPDRIALQECQGWDKEDGDAARISEKIQHFSLSYIHASQLWEHLPDPEAAIRDWAKCLKKGGHIIVTVPDVGAYENFTYPSKYNPDHKASFSMIYRGSAFPVHVHIPTFCEKVSDILETRLARYVEANYDWKKRGNGDQTYDPSGATEIWNEIVWRKK